MPTLARDGGRADHDRGAVDDRDRAHVDRDRARARAARHRSATACSSDGDVLNVLRWIGPGRRARPTRSTCSATRRSSAARSRSSRSPSSATPASRNAHLRGAPLRRLAHDRRCSSSTARALVEAGERFVYAYYPGVDNVAHEFGLHDGVLRARARVRRPSRRATCSTRCPRDATLLVTADHGQVHLERDDWIELPELAAAGRRDGRRRSLPLPVRAARAPRRSSLGRARELARRPRVGVVARRAARRRAGSATGATGTIPGRIGDVVLAARDAVAFVDPALAERGRALRSGHGSLTADEMYVPLVAASGTGS